MHEFWFGVFAWASEHNLSTWWVGRGKQLERMSPVNGVFLKKLVSMGYDGMVCIWASLSRKGENLNPCLAVQRSGAALVTTTMMRLFECPFSARDSMGGWVGGHRY